MDMNVSSVTNNENKFVNKSAVYYNKFSSTVKMDVCNSYPEYHVDFTQLLPVTIGIAVAYCIVILLAILGNLLVVWTVWKNNHMHTVTNYYIVNLAVSDLLIATIVMPLKLLEYSADCEWHVFIWDGLCSVVYYFQPIFVFASVLTLVAISIERYHAIVYPLSVMKINSTSRTRKIIAGTWIIPLVVGSPFVYCRNYAFTIYSEYGTVSRAICTDRFEEIDAAIYPNDPSRKGEFRKVYFIFLFCVIYVIPSAVILTTCVRIAVSLMQPINIENSIFGRKESSRKQEENRRKVARMVVAIAITFIVSWSPQYIVSIVSQLQTRSFLEESNFLFTMLITHFCGFVNSCLNPIIYTAMSENFRRSFIDILRRICYCFCYCCSCRKFLQYNVQYTTPSRRFTSTVRHTLTDIENRQHLTHIFALNETTSRSYFLNGGRENKTISSSRETDIAVKESKRCGGKAANMFVFRNNDCNKSRRVREESNKTLVLDNVNVSAMSLKDNLKRQKSVKSKEAVQTI